MQGCSGGLSDGHVVARSGTRLKLAEVIELGTWSGMQFWTIFYFKVAVITM